MLLRTGDRGPEVELLQLGLNRAGFLAPPPDGIFGPLTGRALVEFQKSRGLTPDGIAGPVSFRALEGYLLGRAEHRIRPGDTLYRLARIYGTTLGSIEAANPDLDPYTLPVGAVIKVPYGFPVVPRNISFTPTVLEICIRGLMDRYPFIGLEVIGRSIADSPIFALTVGRGSNHVMYNGSHHANEWITSALLMCFLEEYASAIALDKGILGMGAKELFERTCLHLVPMVNPDGVALAAGAIRSGYLYEAARAIADRYPEIAFPDGWKANIRGTDLNLQYPAGWEMAREIKYSQGFITPAPRDYVGAAPLSEPESRAIYDYTLKHDFSLTLSYHTQGQVIFWKYLDMEPPGAYQIGRYFSALSGYYLAETPRSSGYAGYKDWFILNYDRPGYTVEAGSGENPLPIRELDRILEDNLGILVAALTAT
ncbi:MAG: peptidoglycan-binding protein [Oscillospiraceae bacterium]|nr:peptidoglycan-binding protein [Oscillospiraceae bacterium]